MGSENIQHFAGCRLRLQGSGNLNPELVNLDDNPVQVMVPMPMTLMPSREPLRLANFTGQRVRFRVGTTAINEVFTINRIIIFVKELWSDYPA